MGRIKAAFLTSKEALEFINSRFDNPIIGRTSTGSNNFDIDNIPFTFDGELSAYEVNGGEAIVAFWEPEDASYTISFNSIKRHADSLHEARAIARGFAAAAEDANCPGDVIITDDNNSEVIETITIEDFDDEPIATAADVEKLIARRDLGAKIANARKLKGLSIAALAKAADLSKNNIVRIEQGRYNYTIDNLYKISKALDLDIDLV